MKKLLLILFGAIVVFIITLKFGLLSYFPSSKQNAEKLPNGSPVAEISQVDRPPIIGVYYRMIDKQTADQNNLIEGAYVTKIIKGSPAEKAGIQDEDIIVEFDGKAIGGTDKQTLTNFVSEKSPGEKVLLKIWRNNIIRDVTVILKLEVL
ncbi:MAG: PDZ domain-containing protein [Patescibacteria group bacterium]